MPMPAPAGARASFSSRRAPSSECRAPAAARRARRARSDVPARPQGRTGARSWRRRPPSADSRGAGRCTGADRRRTGRTRSDAAVPTAPGVEALGIERFGVGPERRVPVRHVRRDEHRRARRNPIAADLVVVHRVAGEAPDRRVKPQRLVDDRLRYGSFGRSSAVGGRSPIALAISARSLAQHVRMAGELVQRPRQPARRSFRVRRGRSSSPRRALPAGSTDSRSSRPLASQQHRDQIARLAPAFGHAPG